MKKGRTRGLFVFYADDVFVTGWECDSSSGDALL